MKTLNGVSIRNKGWSEAKTLKTAMTGYHGGYKAGIAIWSETLSALEPRAIKMLVSNLKSAGIPIR